MRSHTSARSGISGISGKPQRMYTKNIDEIGKDQQPVPELVIKEVDTTELKKKHEKDVNRTQEIVSQFL